MAEFEADDNSTAPARGSAPSLTSDASNQHARMFYQGNALLTSAIKDFRARDGGGTPSEIDFPPSRSGSLLRHEKIDRIDFLSMDEQGRNESADQLRHPAHASALVCIEAHREVRQWLLDVFHQRGCIMIGKHGRGTLHLLGKRANAERLATWKSPGGL